MFFDSIFIVNLVRRPDRWKSIISELSKTNINFKNHNIQKVAAYDGSLFDTPTIEQSHLLSPVGLDRYKKLNEKQKIWGMDLSAGGIGCALSHVDIWCSVIEQNLERALVLEDDTIMSETFLDKTRNEIFPALPQDWECVFLSGLDPENQCKFLRVKKVSSSYQQQQQEHFICRVPRIYRTTNCYMINAKGAKSLLQSCVPFTFQLDTAMTTMLVGDGSSSENNKHSSSTGMPVDSSLMSPETKSELKKKSPQEQQSLQNEFVSVFPSYCVDPPLAAQATRFGTDIQWKNHERGEHDIKDEERSRLRAAGIIVE